jgi:SAM-dependent methyltransferase
MGSKPGHASAPGTILRQVASVEPSGRYEFLDFNAPLSDSRADSVADSLARQNPRSVLDVGCGWGEMLLRILSRCDQASGVGIDQDAELLDRGRANALERGLSSRVNFVEDTVPVEGVSGDVVICIGADHAFGTQLDALQALWGMVKPGGRVLFGSGFWERTPLESEAASVGMAPKSLSDLGGLVDMAVALGFRPLFIQTANRDEWESFESRYLADYEAWLVDHNHQPEADVIRVKADTHRREWLTGYRDVLGFAYLTLGRGRTLPT